MAIQITTTEKLYYRDYHNLLRELVEAKHTCRVIWDAETNALSIYLTGTTLTGIEGLDISIIKECYSKHQDNVQNICFIEDPKVPTDAVSVTTQELISHYTQNRKDHVTDEYSWTTYIMDVLAVRYRNTKDENDKWETAFRLYLLCYAPHEYIIQGLSCSSALHNGINPANNVRFDRPDAKSSKRYIELAPNTYTITPEFLEASTHLARLLQRTLACCVHLYINEEDKKIELMLEGDKLESQTQSAAPLIDLCRILLYKIAADNLISIRYMHGLTASADSLADSLFIPVAGKLDVTAEDISLEHSHYFEVSFRAKQGTATSLLRSLNQRPFKIGEHHLLVSNQLQNDTMECSPYYLESMKPLMRQYYIPPSLSTSHLTAQINLL